MNVLVTGKNGQLGSEIHFLEKEYSNFNFIYTDIDELDITNTESVNNFFKNNYIDFVINCAAYTAVDKAEDDIDIANRVNNLAVHNLVNCCLNHNCKIIHISTDYVFNGTKYTPYIETDEVAPMGVYGITKLKGEKQILDSNVKGLIIRTSWVYSSFGNNFVKTMLKLGKSRDGLTVIYDQVGTPTYARDLAKVCLEIIVQNPPLDSKPELYHYSNEGICSWYDFAKSIMEIENIDCKVIPVETKDFVLKAERPHYSVLNKAKIKNEFNIEIPHWRDSLKKMLIS